MDRDALYVIARKGGSRKVSKGLAKVSPERRKEIARMGGFAKKKGSKKKLADPFNV